MTATEAPPTDSMVRCRDGQGLEHRASLVKLSRFQVVFEVCGPACTFRMSEVLQDFRILIEDRVAYSGRAVVSNLISAGSVMICEAALEEPWADAGAVPGIGMVHAGFQKFIQRWHGLSRVLPEYKLAVADLQAFMTQLRLWVEQLELGIQALPAADRFLAEREAVHQLAESASPALRALFEKFEEVCRRVDPELAPVHAAYCRRQLHPLLMASPFMHRIYVKPLGYAGDYEMVNMIVRDPCEGVGLFAKLLNVFILSQVPAIAHRNRVAYLTQKLTGETLRCRQLGRMAKIMNFGCGPAREVQDFLRGHDLCEHASLDLLDFDKDAIAYAQRTMEGIKLECRRGTRLKLIRNSVQQVLRQAVKAVPPAQPYDFVYCAGLFDYLNRRTCESLVAYFHQMLAPGGLLVVTNVETQHPIRNIMEYIFEWHLIYRNGAQLAALVPKELGEESVSVKMDATAGNIFLEVRKPLHQP